LTPITKKTNDLLVDAPVETAFGYETILRNVGSVSNKGVELQINADVIRRRGKAFNWRSSFVLAHNINEVLNLGDNTDKFYPQAPSTTLRLLEPLIVQVGQPLGTFWGYKTDGIVQSGDDLSQVAKPGWINGTVQPGDRKYVNVKNDDNVINADDKVFLGSSQPKFTFGFTNSFSYKGFDLLAIIQGSHGNKIYNALKQQLEITTLFSNTLASALDRWTPENPSDNVPRATSSPVAVVSDRYIEDGSYVRLKNLTLGYSLPAKILTPAKITKARVFLTGQNLFTLTDYSGYDPEVSSYEQDVESVYEQIIQDLTDAEELPSSYSGSDIGRATGGAAKSLLAKVYLVRREWRKSYEKACEVITGDYGYELFKDFGDVTAMAAKNGKEHIFSAQFENGQQGTIGRAGNTLTYACFIGFSNIEPADIISDTRLFYDEAYEPGDFRKDASYAKTLVNPANGNPYTFAKPLFMKFLEWSFVEQNIARTAAGVNFPVLRYADVLLIYAEALNEANHGPGNNDSQAYWAINQIRRRAFGFPLDSPSTADLSGLDEVGFREAIQKERLREFVQEGQRWFDLVRWGILLEALHSVPAKAGATERNYLFPIPQDQRNLNPDGLWQNEGY
jgi:hypothetical protein